MTKTTSNKFDRIFRTEKFDQSARIKHLEFQTLIPSARNEHLKSKSSFRVLETNIC